MSAGRVLLTGATGFVGRRLAADLAGRGWTVRAALRSPGALSPADGVAETVAADLTAPTDWAEALEGVDAVVHAAGIAHAGTDLPESLYERVNHRATVELAHAAAGRVRRFVFLSSIRAQSGPTAPEILTEESPVAPTDAYGRSKLAAEGALASLDLEAVSLRPVVVYGPGVKGNVALLLKLARLPVPLPLGGLRAPRSVVSLDNLSDAVLTALAPAFAGRGPLIVADPQPTSVAAIVAGMRAAWGRGPGLIDVPPGLLARAAALAGRAETWDRLAGPMAADPRRLITLGWQPPVMSTAQGLARWLQPRPARG